MVYKSYQIIYTILLFISIIFFCGCGEDHKSYTIKWLNLTEIDSLEKREVFYTHKLSSILFNGILIQTEAECDTCRFSLKALNVSRFIQYELSLTDLPFKDSLQLKTNKLELRFARNDANLSTLDKFTSLFSRELVIDYTILPNCDSVNKIVLQEINNDKSDLTAKIAKRQHDLDLNQLFYRLKNNTLKDFLRQLPNSDKDIDEDCLNFYHLLSFIKDNEQSGFDTLEYELTDEIKKYLDNVVLTLAPFVSSYKLTELKIKCIGYADANMIKKGNKTPANPPFTLHYTQSNNQKPDSLFCYSQLLDESTSVPLEPNVSFSTINKGEYVTDNCRLSALRAINALIYLRTKISEKHPDLKITYLYASGCGLRSSKNKEELARNRKINVKFSFKAAK